MNAREMRRRLRSGERVYGTMIVSNAPRWIDYIADIGLDYIFIDTEHVALDRLDVAWMCQSYRRVGLGTIVRIGSPDPYEATRILDGGADGIVAPYVETVEEVKALVGATKLRPLKGEKLRRILNGEEVLEGELKRYVEKNNDGNVLIINIESVAAIENLDRILEVPGVDAVLVGPHDLSTSLGVPEQYDSPIFLEAVDTIIRNARSHGVGAGVHNFASSIDQEIDWINTGANLVLHRLDLFVFIDVMKKEVAQIREAAGDGAPSEGPTSMNI